MRQSKWWCAVFFAAVSLAFLTFVKMTPLERFPSDFQTKRSRKDCRFQIHVTKDIKTGNIVQKVWLDGHEIDDGKKCNIEFGQNQINRNQAINFGMLHYSIGVGMQAQGYKSALGEGRLSNIKQLYQGAELTCGPVKSCVQVMDDEPIHMPGSPARRRLLAQVGVGDPAMIGTGDHDLVWPYHIGATLASCGFILIFVTLLCACHDKKRKDIRKEKQEDEEDGADVTLNKVTLRGSGAAYASPHNGAELYAVPSKGKDDSRRNGCKEENNGGMGHKRDDSRGSRCATLDRRLPAPPPSIPSLPDDLDPTYDVIPHDKQPPPHSPLRPPDTDSQSYEPVDNRIYAVPEENKKSTEILYEEVTNTNTNRPQSMIEDIMERTSMMEASIHSVHSVQSQHSRQSHFSDSDERPTSNMSHRLSIRSFEEHYASPDEARMSSGEATPVADVRHSFPGSLYEEEFAPEPPPVPARRYGEDEIINSGILPEELLQPYVPPLIAAAAFPLLSENSEVAAVPALPTIAPQPIVPVIATVPAIPLDFQETSDPRYIQVTARESLASIRARQALQRHDYDNFYEPIDGDDPPPPPVRPISPPRASLDMYGADYDEINYAVAGNPNDDQSDTGLYSDIKDSPVPSPVPGPPRVPPLHNASPLMENTSIIYADADSPLPDRRNRSMTTGAVPSTSNGHRDPVYAVPHKPRLRARSEAPETCPVYAIVDKPRKKDSNENSMEASASSDFDVCAPLANYDAEMSFDKSPSYEGVRVPTFDTTEIRTRPNDPPSDRTSVDSGLYQRVDVDEKPKRKITPPQAQETRYSNLCEDANYSIIPHEEKLLAKEQMFHMSNHHVPEDFWVRQEHVYQELDEDPTFTNKREIPVTVL